ncbi:MAG TPA: ubiquitin-like small modifier protein 1 [Gemmataceae bacterium]|jgi:molybdopterin synthase sulfur carrier subunit|nr:ubiquitin-like small modifier protein 1 [Gemmataceae bacterium]
MAIRIHIPTPMRQHTDGQAVVEVSGATVQGALDALGQKFPAIVQRIFENGQVRRFVNIYLNDEDVRYLENLKTAVKDGDEVSIIPAVAGG